MTTEQNKTQIWLQFADFSGYNKLYLTYDSKIGSIHVGNVANGHEIESFEREFNL
jgi:hypothetical protein